MGVLKDQMINFMTLRGYSTKTIESYTRSVEVMAYHFMKSPLSLTRRDVDEYFLCLRKSKLADASIHLAYQGIRFFYRMHRISNMVPFLRFPGKFHRLPVVRSRSEVSNLLAHCPSLKSKVMFYLIYSCGLRVSEAAKIKVTDIDFDRKTIFVRRGKGKKDRYTVLGEKMAKMLRDYILIHRSEDYLFPSKTGDSHLSVDAIQRRFRQIVSKAGMSKAIHVHTLRHCFATHLLENGTNLVYIMKLLGHSSIQTTMVYLHIQSIESMNVQSPMDTLPMPTVTRTQQLEMFQQSA